MTDYKRLLEYLTYEIEIFKSSRQSTSTKNEISGPVVNSIGSDISNLKSDNEINGLDVDSNLEEIKPRPKLIKKGTNLQPKPVNETHPSKKNAVRWNI